MKIKTYIRKFRNCFYRRLVKMRLRHFFIGYFLIVLFSAIINYWIFWKDSTSFLISDQMNKHVERYEFLDPEINLAAFHENAKDRMPVSFEGVYKLIEPNITRLETLSIALKANQRNYLIFKKEQRKVYKIADVERHKMIEEFIDSMMKGSRRRIDSLQE